MRVSIFCLLKAKEQKTIFANHYNTQASSIMIEIFLKGKDSGDVLLKKYKRRLDSIRFNKKQSARLFFRKPSEKRSKEIQKAILRQRYLQEHGLV